jgi:penicillin-binding protein 1C
VRLRLAVNSAIYNSLRASWQKHKPPRWWLLAAGLMLLPIAALLVGACFCSLPPELRAQQSEQSLRVEDRDGRLLREVRTRSGALSKWVPLSAMPAALPKMLVAVEDRRFYYHPGVDPIATLRALVHDVWRLRVVSGASTITMQLARALRPHRRNLWGKCAEMALALRIEASLPKARVLEEYLNRVDFGPNLRGIGAAAQGYFGKPVGALSLAEMAMLVGLPQAPSTYALHRRSSRAAIARRNRVLNRAAEAHIASAEAIASARAEPLQLERRHPVFGAPHLIATLLSGNSAIFQNGLSGTETRSASRIRTTLDPVLQRAAETVITSAIPLLRTHHVSAGAALVVDNASGEVLAYVGSPNFFDIDHQGQVDGVRALRQPGSTLKPFVYAAAIDELGYTPATALPDLELHLRTEGGDYAPRNFDDKIHGPVRLREALGNSLNIPAVYTASELGPPTLLRVLHAFGFDSLKQQPDYYGPALALGDGEVTLVELVRAYATLARGGRLVPLHAVSEWELPQHDTRTGAADVRTYEAPDEPRVISSVAAALITDILADNRARASSFGLESTLHFDAEVAAKTGTSKGYRDNWVVGYSHCVTVGVWVGNFDGSPMREVSGITGAGPIFHAIMEAVFAQHPDASMLASMGVQDNNGIDKPDDIQHVEICPLSGQARGPDCPQSIWEYVPSKVTLPQCRWHRKLPLDRGNGLLAGPDCPTGKLTEQLFEVFPPEYAAWAKSQGRALPPESYSPNCPEAPSVVEQGAESSLRITEPADGARYVIDPERPLKLQQLAVTVLAPATIREVSLEVDGVGLGQARRPFEFHWQLHAGHHRLVAVDSSGRRSAAVEVDVRE